MLRTIAHSIMVRAVFLEAYIHFVIMYTADHVFTVLPIKDVINKDGDQSTSSKLATGMKPSISHLRVSFCPFIVGKATKHVGTKALNMRHQAQNEFLRYLRWYSTEFKRVSYLCSTQTKDNIFLQYCLW